MTLRHASRRSACSSDCARCGGANGESTAGGKKNDSSTRKRGRVEGRRRRGPGEGGGSSSSAGAGCLPEETSRAVLIPLTTRWHAIGTSDARLMRLLQPAAKAAAAGERSGLAGRRLLDRRKEEKTKEVKSGEGRTPTGSQEKIDRCCQTGH